MQTQAKFFVGQIIHHIKFGYRGVVADVDPDFQGSEEWYEEVARSQPPKDQPWYHVLVDGASHMTYVAERHLGSAMGDTPINNPGVDVYFTEFKDGIYHHAQIMN